MKIYTDIDHVLHDYSSNFIKVAFEHFKVNGFSKKIKFTKKNSYSPIGPYISYFNMDEDLVSSLVQKANRIEGHIPTLYYKPISKWIINEIKKGSEVIAVTARSDRQTAEKIIKECLGENIPVITADSKYKHLVIEDNSVYFEDHPISIREVLNKRKNVTIVVPKWPWNLDTIVYKNVCCLDRNNLNNLNNLIEERLSIYV